MDDLEICRGYRRRILEVSQMLDALHVAPAFSCLEIVDAVLRRSMDSASGGADSFILSKGHGAMAHYVVLEGLGVLDPSRSTGSRRRDHESLGIPIVVCPA